MKKSEIEAFAKQTLKDHNMYSIPVDPVLLANKLGIRVSNAVFSEPTISGMIAKRGENCSLLINDNDTPYRKRFSIAHELGHCLLHLFANDGEFIDNEIDLFRIEAFDADGKQLQEIEANQFAAALLMDAELIKEYWPVFKTLNAMAEAFKVSEAAMGIRLSGLGLV